MTHTELGILEKSKERYLFNPKSFNPKSFNPKSYPKLRPGVKFFKFNDKNNQQSSSNIYVGFSHRGIEVKNEIASQLLQLLDGSQSLESILRIVSVNVTAFGIDPGIDPGIDADVSEANNLLQVLNDANLIEFRAESLLAQLVRNKYKTDKGATAKGATAKSDLLPVNLVNSFNRMQAEENLYGWHPAVTTEKDSQTIINQRRNFAIVIFGRNRLALSLFGVLQASGFSVIKIIDRMGSTNSDSLVQISPDEVCGLAIRGSDVGLRKTLVIADIARNSQLFPTENLEFPLHPNFIISTESIPQEIMQQWMSEEIPHLVVSNLIENKIILGPIVLPGKTPCLNCLNLWRSEQFPHHSSFEFLSALDSEETKGLEIPSAQVALLTGLLATYVIEYCASVNLNGADGGVGVQAKAPRLIEAPMPINAPRLIGTTLTLNLFDPLNFETSEDESVGYRYWQPHLSCGCQRLI